MLELTMQPGSPNKLGRKKSFARLKDLVFSNATEPPEDLVRPGRALERLASTVGGLLKFTSTTKSSPLRSQAFPRHSTEPSGSLEAPFDDTPSPGRATLPASSHPPALPTYPHTTNTRSAPFSYVRSSTLRPTVTFTLGIRPSNTFRYVHCNVVTSAESVGDVVGEAVDDAGSEIGGSMHSYPSDTDGPTLYPNLPSPLRRANEALLAARTIDRANTPTQTTPYQTEEELDPSLKLRAMMVQADRIRRNKSRVNQLAGEAGGEVTLTKGLGIRARARIISAQDDDSDGYFGDKE